ncbi:MAG: OmpA family protein [Bacteroidia bacterium]|nr:OmpA family protein [Bacteroidia bacterium]
MNKLIISLAAMLISNTTAIAQDAEGCKDHPLLSRMPDYTILDCTQNFNQLDFLNTKGEDIKLEGNLTFIWYVFNSESQNKEPSFFQIIKNYSNAIIKIGGKKIYEDNISGYYELKKNGKEYNIKVVGTNNSDILLSVLEMEAMKQEVTANEMLDALNKDGYIALNILFESGKSTIQQESLPVIDQIFDLLKSNSTLNVSIEGHTDNVGEAAGNKKLSDDRAKAVMVAIIAKGIEKIRLSFIGWGQEKPIADNRTDEGRTKNRRVEIVKKQ